MNLEHISIGIYLLMMIFIGIYAYRKSTANSEEFLIAGRKMGAAVTALSAGAADMSGWLLMGVPGAMYFYGISSAWIAIGLTLGAYLNYVFIAPRLRIYTEIANNAITLPVFFENRFRDQSQIFKIVASIFILLFFTLYTSAGMVSGGRLFEFAFGLDYTTGLLITSFVVVLYTFLGGFLAVSLTDFVQGTIMVLALVIVPFVLLKNNGGWHESMTLIASKNSALLHLLEGTNYVTILSLLAWGLGYCGQPHILVRFMAIEKVKDLKKARRIGISWMLLTVGGAMLVGLLGIAYLQIHDSATQQLMDSDIKKAETIFIYITRALFHPLVSGFLLSAILAAVMSTISSQLLVTSSTLTEDLYKAFRGKNASHKQLLFISRGSVLFVAGIAILMSLHPQQSILDLVGNAWAGFGAAFGPLMIYALFWKKTSKWAAFAGMIVGGTTAMCWKYLPFETLTQWYEIIPSFILSMVVIGLGSLFQKRNNHEKQNIEATFQSMQHQLKKYNIF